MRRLVGVSLGFGLCTLLAAEVSAAPPSEGGPPQTAGATAAVLPLAVTGELSEGDRATLADELVKGLQRGSFSVIPPAQVAASSPNASTCAAAECFTKISSQSSATHLVRAEVSVQDRDYQINVTLINGVNGAVMARTEDGCEICGVADVGGLLSAAAATLRTKLDALASGPATLLLTSNPPDADVYLDGELVGVTPLDQPVIPGKHVLRIVRDGYISIEREMTFVEGVEESLDMSLDKVPSRLPGRRWGWASLGVGVVALGGGVALTFLHDVDHDPTCKGNDVDPNGNCRFLWDTKWAGAGTAIGGAALTTLGVAILLSTRKSKTKKIDNPDKASAKVGVGIGSLHLRGRF